jgi:hypothetical protein
MRNSQLSPGTSEAPLQHIIYRSYAMYSASAFQWIYVYTNFFITAKQKLFDKYHYLLRSLQRIFAIVYFAWFFCLHSLCCSHKAKQDTRFVRNYNRASETSPFEQKMSITWLVRWIYIFIFILQKINNLFMRETNLTLHNELNYHLTVPALK